MAQHNINKDIEFFYSNDDSIDKLFEEISARFSYQKVVVIGKCNKLKKTYNDIRKTVNFTMLFYSNTKSFENSEDIALIICANNLLIDDCKRFCFDNNKFLVIYMQQYISLNYFMQESEKSSILGIIADKSAIEENISEFKINISLDYSTVIFDEAELLVNNLFFNKKYDFNQKKLNFNEFLQNISKNYDDLMDEYVVLTKYFEKRQTNILDNFTYKNNVTKNNYYKLVLVEIILSIYKLFTSKISLKLKRIMNCENLTLSNKNFNNYITFQNTFDEEKFWFVRQKFGYQICAEMDNYISKLSNIKNLCFLLDVDKMYSIMSDANFIDIKNKIKQVAINYDKDCYLKLINYFGYLDFN